MESDCERAGGTPFETSPSVLSPYPSLTEDEVRVFTRELPRGDIGELS